MDEFDLSHFRIANTFKTFVLALILPVLLVACGGIEDTGSNPVTSSPASDTATSASADTTTSNSATLAWDAVAATNLSGYRIYYGTAPGTYLQPFGQGLSVGNVTTYVLMGLSNGMRYYFTVTAIDTLGNESVFSNEAFKDIP